MLLWHSRRLRPLLATGRRSLQTQSGLQAAEPARAAEPTPLSSLQDNFLNGTSATYLESLAEQAARDSSKLDPSWSSFFKRLDSGMSLAALSQAYSQYRAGNLSSSSAAATATSPAIPVTNQTLQDTIHVQLLIRAYQVVGHQAATLDPLGTARPTPEELEPSFYGFNDADLEREFYIGFDTTKGLFPENMPTIKLREIISRLREVYCGNIGFEYLHIPNRERVEWLRERIETLRLHPLSKERKLHCLDRLSWSEHFESFLKTKYAAAKRFGLEGAETLVPGMKAMIDYAAEMGCESIIVGMPHRGRLNVLGNVFRKPLAHIFSEFSGKPKRNADGSYSGSGDVKYHLGTSYDRPTIHNKTVHLSLMANPSHLEAVNTVVMGKTRAKQYYLGDKTRTRVMPILLHGDGSFSGQGIVMETLDMSTLPEYDVGGVVHIVVNNQVAFTTDPKRLRSSLPYTYCTDNAKGFNVPVFHVNGDDVESVVRVFELAAEWRQKWHEDVVIDIVCYRKHGHNEIDEPMFTQPMLYSKIRKHQNALQIYSEQLVRSGVVSDMEVKAISNRVLDILQQEYEASKTYVPQVKDWLASYWAGFKSPDQLSRIRNTGVPTTTLKSIGERITTIPPSFNAHKQVRKIYDERRKMVADEHALVDWAMAEALAFGTLLQEGNHVRLAGQDVERGTFSHRHAVLHDQENGDRYIPLTTSFDAYTPRQFTITNSSLSEFGALGYELGYSLENPNSLVLWEAQFGDFANSAQVIFDQFLSAGEAKWLRQTGLVCMLPHGYDGQGPEHSSARLERFLQMCDENPYSLPKVDESQWFRGGHLGSQIQSRNWQVCNITTPANYYHALRRQLHREFRKPLIIMSPKALLRHPSCKSKFGEFDDVPDDALIQGVRFKRLIMDDGATDRSPRPPAMPSYKRVVFCSGKVYYDLAAQRAKEKKEGEVAICRVEQLAPFPFDLVARELRRYPNAEVMWCQEEPMNMGAYFFVVPRMLAVMGAEGRTVSSRLPYAGRAPSASTATGFGEVHQQEQAELVGHALDMTFSGTESK